MPKKIMNHGMTEEQMDSLRYDQQHGKVKTVKANFVEHMTDKYFKKEYGNYQIPEYEQHLYHCAMEARTFDSGSGEKLSRSRVQTFTVDNYNRMKETQGFVGETVVILHNPKYDAKAAAKKAAEAAKEAAAKQAAGDKAEEAASDAQKEYDAKKEAENKAPEKAPGK